MTEKEEKQSRRWGNIFLSCLFRFMFFLCFFYTDHPVLIPKMWDEWGLAQVELADGFYPSVCVTLRVAFDHMAIGVLGSFSVVTVMHAVLWNDFISGENFLFCMWGGSLSRVHPHFFSGC